MRKELVEQAMQRTNDPQMRLNYLREQLQRIILTALHEAGAFRRIAFVGGTCLRIVYGLPRYSEDLDFSLIDCSGYDFVSFLKKVETKLNAIGFEHTIKVNTKNIVHVAQIGFPQIRSMVGENPMADAKLTIKVEVDTNPPSGWQTVQHIQRSDFGLTALVSYDLASLFSGKLHALCCRKYTKGRDWYDLVWYLTRQPPAEPNLGLLSKAVAQTEGDAAWEGGIWRSRLLLRLEQLDFDAVKQDIAPFIERKEELSLFSAEALMKMVRGTS
jgi:predicted nucleotidyltransferase component of viral defense system